MKVQKTSSINAAKYIDNTKTDNDYNVDMESVRTRTNLTANLAAAKENDKTSNLEIQQLAAANSSNDPQEINNKQKKSRKIVQLKSINTKSDIIDINEQQNNYLADNIVNNHSNKLEELQQKSMEKHMGDITDHIKSNIKKSKLHLAAATISNAIITTGLISFDLDELFAATLISAHGGTLVLAIIALSRIPHHINIEKIFVKLMRNDSLNEKEKKQLEKYLNKMKKNNPELTDAKIAELLEMGKNTSRRTKNHINLNYYEQIDQQKSNKADKSNPNYEQAEAEAEAELELQQQENQKIDEGINVY
jgi:hypothetical protein